MLNVLGQINLQYNLVYDTDDCLQLENQIKRLNKVIYFQFNGTMARRLKFAMVPIIEAENCEIFQEFKRRVMTCAGYMSVISNLIFSY